MENTIIPKLRDTISADFDPQTGRLLSDDVLQESSDLTDFEQEVFAKRTRRLLQVTDVGDGPRDFDAHETILARHLQLQDNRIYSTGDNPGVLAYAADFTTDLQKISEDVIRRAALQAKKNGRNLPADVVEALQTLDTSTLRILLNSAPRNQQAAEGRNGRDFHLGLTADGIEVYAVPVSSLRYIRSKLVSLFRIPTNGHPLTEDGEQFRSSLFGQSAHSAQEHLVPLWRREDDNEEELDTFLPTVTEEEVAYKDAPFCNRRVFSPNVERFLDQIESNITCSDRTVRVQIGNTPVRAYRVKNLAEIPGGQWGIYANVADGNGRASGYVELNKRLPDGGSIEDPSQRSDQDLQPEDRHLGVSVRILPRE
jgi:hypothetical protein